MTYYHVDEKKLLTYGYFMSTPLKNAIEKSAEYDNLLIIYQDDVLEVTCLLTYFKSFVTFLKSKKIVLNLEYTLSNIDNSETIFKIDFDEKLFQAKKITINKVEVKLNLIKEIRPPVNLFSTIDKSTIDEPIVETDGHYYIVKEIEVRLDGFITTDEKEHKFCDYTMYTNKVKARLFYDDKIAKMLFLSEPIDTQTKLEIYLVRNSNLVQNQKYLLVDSYGYEHIENKKLESFLLVSIGSNKNGNTNSSKDTIYTKNNFLDADYKD